MYFLNGFPTIFKILLNSSPIEIKLSEDKLLLCAISLTSIHIYNLEPFLELFSSYIDEEFVNLYGTFITFTWNKTSNILALSTKLGYLQYFLVEADKAVSNEYSIIRNREKSLPGIGHGFLLPTIPQVILTKLDDCLMLKSEITCISQYFNQILVTTKDGTIAFFEWPKSRVVLKNPVYKFYISDILGPKERLQSNLFVVHIAHSWILSGFALILSDGRCGYISHSQDQFIKENLKINFAPHIKNGTFCCFNDRFRLITFGTSNSQVLSYTHDEATNSLKVVADSRKRPFHSPTAATNEDFYTNTAQDETVADEDSQSKSVSIKMLASTADGMALGLVKENGWILESVYGHPLIKVLSNSGHDPTLTVGLRPQVDYISAGFGQDNYSLWVLARFSKPAPLNDKGHSTLDYAIVKYDMVKSVSSYNSSFSGNHKHLVLQGPTSIYVGLPLYPMAAKFNERVQALRARPGSDSLELEEQGDVYTASLDCFFENREFTEIQIPTIYANYNKPIRIAAIDKSGQGIVVGGRRGFLHYNILTRKWKLFGNETQEKEFAVYGGLVWWREFILLSCLNLEQDMYELRAYPQASRLDNVNMATRLQLPNQISVYQLDVYRDYLAALFSNLTISLYLLSTQSQAGKKEIDSPTMILTNVYTMDISSLSVHPFCIVSFALTFFSADSKVDGGEADLVSNDTNDKSLTHVNSISPNLVINVSGDLILLELQKKRSSSFNGSDIISSKDSGTAADLISTGTSAKEDGYSVSLVSSNVENFWVHDIKAGPWPKQHVADRPVSPIANTPKPCAPPPYLLDTMWIFRGSEGFKLWLPLPRPAGFSLPKYDLFSKRIIINFPINLYPLAVHFSGAIVEGVSPNVIKDRTLDYLAGVPTLASTQVSPPPPRTTNLKRAMIDALIGRRRLGITRSVQYILPDILRELIDKNLSLQALDIAEFYRQRCEGASDTLPIFLETLLHRVVEMDQTGHQKENSAAGQISQSPPYTPVPGAPSAPDGHQLLTHKKSKNLSAPDPLLPRVLAFLREFPEYFKIITGCARKSEIALWPRLFMYAGSEPAQLFKESIAKGDLQTATFFLIVLQNLEPFSRSRQDIEVLLKTTLDREQWHLSHEIVRYLKSIGGDEKDLGSPNSCPSPNATPETQPVAPGSKNFIDKRFSYPTVKAPFVKPLDRRKEGSLDLVDNFTSDCLYCKGANDSPTNPKSDSSLYLVEQFLDQYAQNLLIAEQWKRLGTFAANMSFPLVQWLSKQKNTGARVKNYVESFKRLHDVFEWPYGYAFHIESKTQSSNDKVDSHHLRPVTNFTPLKVGNQLPQLNLTPTNSLLSTSDVNLAKLLEPLQIRGPSLGPRGKDLSPPSVCDTLAYMTNSPDKDVKVWHLPTFDNSTLPNSKGGEEFAVQRPSSLNLTPKPTTIAKQGSKDRDEVQLRYLLKIFMESGCLDRALLICIMLSDTQSTPSIIASWLQRIVDQHSGPDQKGKPDQDRDRCIGCPNLETVSIIINGLRILLKWSETECTDYECAIYQCLNPIQEIYDISNGALIEQIMDYTDSQNVNRHAKLPTTKTPLKDQQGYSIEEVATNTLSKVNMAKEGNQKQGVENKEHMENNTQGTCIIS